MKPESNSPIHIDHYRTFSSGLVTVHGNSAEIKEEYFSISDEKRKKLTEEEFRNILNSVSDRVASKENRYQKLVMEFGVETANELMREKEVAPLVPPKRERGDITEFSSKSRYRLLKRYNRMNPDREIKPYHIVLTYPKRFPTDGVEYKADLDAFFKRVKRKFGVIAYLWKLEFQTKTRIAPHYHIVLYLPQNFKIFYLRNWIAKNWYEVAQRFWEYKLENHLKAGTSCDLVTDLKKASFYLSKYISKQDELTLENQGRFWGCSRNWGDIVLSEVQLTAQQLIQFRRLVKRFLKGHLRMCKLVTRPINLTIFGHWSFFVDALNWVQETH